MKSKKMKKTVRRVREKLAPFSAAERGEILRLALEAETVEEAPVGLAAGAVDLLADIGDQAGGDWLAMLFEVFKEAMKDVQEDQKYWLKRLEEKNRINDAIQDYMQEITAAAQALNDKVRSAEEEDSKQDCVALDVSNIRVASAGVRVFLRAKQKLQPALDFEKSGSVEVSLAELTLLLGLIEAERETVRNERQLANSQFENANQKATQYMNMLSRVMKTMNEMRMGVVRNIR